MQSRAVKARPSARDVELQLDEARRRSGAALGILFQLYQPYLLAIARETMDPELRGKAGASDLVQQVFIVAQARFGVFRGKSEPEVRRWLRGILLNVIRDWHKRFRDVEKRAATRERSLDDHESQALLTRLAVRGSKSPRSQIEFAEQVGRLETALRRLPAEYRQVILWHNFQRRSFVDIAEVLSRSPDSVRMLHVRAVRRLAREMRTKHDFC